MDKMFRPRFKAETVAKTSFDIRDPKGRVLGYKVSITPGVWGEPGEYGYHQSAGDKFEMGQEAFYVHCWPTRNGVPYGPHHNGHYFATRAEADTFAQKQAEAARKRYAKQFA